MSVTNVAFVSMNTTVVSPAVTVVSLYAGEDSCRRISEPVFDVVSMS